MVKWRGAPCRESSSQLELALGTSSGGIFGIRLGLAVPQVSMTLLLLHSMLISAQSTEPHCYYCNCTNSRLLGAVRRDGSRKTTIS